MTHCTKQRRLLARLVWSREHGVDLIVVNKILGQIDGHMIPTFWNEKGRNVTTRSL